MTANDPVGPASRRSGISIVSPALETDMNRKRILIVAGLALMLLGVRFMTAQEKQPVKGQEREADRQAIDMLGKQFIAAFNKRDAVAVAANYTADAEFIRNDGDPIRGRAEIEKGYANFFRTLKGKSTLEIQTDNLRFPSADSAVVEVTLRLKNEAGEIIASSWRNSLLVREGGQWKVAMVNEWDRDTGADVSLAELEWLVGTWHATNKDKELTLVYEWDANKAFIRGQYSVKEGGKVIDSGTQMIGKDNAEGAIHSWVFQSDGGFGDGLWTRDGQKWSVDVSGVTPDGRTMTATAVYLRIDANTFVWQGVDQDIDGEPVADTPPIKVSKEKGGK
jgi:uncharacterized protein (TIGR02246 family)